MEFLNYHHPRYFWVVAKEGGLRKAADKPHVSQPTISAQIAALEGVLEEKLFRRGGRSLTPTEAGHRVLILMCFPLPILLRLGGVVPETPTDQAHKQPGRVLPHFPRFGMRRQAG